MSWLKQASMDHNKPKTGIIHVLRQNMAAYEQARDHSVVHASDVTYSSFCPRHWALLDLSGGKPKGQYVATALRATYDLGHATADTLITEWGADRVIGNWRCKSCRAQRFFTTKPKNGCKLLDRDCHWQYQELRFESKEYGISGSLDVLFDLGATQLVITELKTYAADEWEKMVAPLPEHRVRTQLYMKIVADSASGYANRINLHEARVFYVSRGFGKMNAEYNEILPFKEFVIKRDDQSPDLQRALKKGKQIKIFREQQLMPSGICGSPMDKQAKACSTCQACFSGQYPAQQEAL